MDIIGDTKIDFLGKRKAALVISALLIFIGVIAVVAIPTGKAKLGTDFSGGVAIQYRFEDPIRIDEVRGLLSDGGFSDADLQEFSGSKKLLVRVKRTEGDLQLLSEKIGEAFTAGIPENPFEVDSKEVVGPTVGKKLQRDALKAVAVSLLFILLYIAWRFEFRFGVAAVVATFHDVIAVLGIVFVLNMEINLLIVTALLTLAGYSLTDTVVVFDRIRENLRQRTREGFTGLLNRSINEVLRRTIVTSGTTLLVLIALIVIGGDVIHDFSLTLAIGVLVGTYSSIFVASPILLVWKGKKGKLVKDQGEGQEAAS